MPTMINKFLNKLKPFLKHNSSPYFITKFILEIEQYKMHI